MRGPKNKRHLKTIRPELVLSGDSINTAGEFALYRICRTNDDRFYVKITEMIINKYGEYVEYMKIEFGTWEEALESLESLIFYNTIPLFIHPNYRELLQEYISINITPNIEELSNEAEDNCRQWIEYLISEQK